MKSFLLQAASILTLQTLFLFCSCHSLSAQTIADWFEKFPHKREYISLQSAPNNAVIVDTKNYYVRVASVLKTGNSLQTTSTVFKMFINEDGTQHFAYQFVDDNSNGSGCVKSVTKIYTVQDNGEWKDVTPMLLPSVRLSEFYGKKNIPNLIDMNGVISFTPKQNQEGTGLGVALEIPQKGTTLLAHLLPRCESSVLPEYATLLQECKYKTIELLWDTQHTWFIIGKKLEK
ncbi:MAG: hypothetical protein EAZ92_01230 [Candidatus Kapaibacterium sp.]|nr:MAG: hypothetical protein EAZ92_01230 [Candidatus Kapabacteria bacterium]